MGEEATIAPGDPGSSEAQRLLAASDAYAASLYPAESNHMLDVAALRRPEVTFLMALLGGRAVGCGALVRYRDYGEMKRVFVADEARGHGIGRALVARLEDEARRDGLALMRLETGTLSAAALALYRAAGYAERPPFGTYAVDPTSVYMEKRLL